MVANIRPVLFGTRILSKRCNNITAPKPIIHNCRFNQSTSSDEDALQEKKKPDSALSTKVEIPDETPGIERKLIFQDFTHFQSTDPIYTLDQASMPAPIPKGFWSFYKYGYLGYQTKDTNYCCRSYENEYTMLGHFPDCTDHLIVGGGLVGSACAYYLKRTGSFTSDVLVIDKDPYSSHNCTAICNGLISTQSKSQDISRVSYLSKELIRNLRNDVLVQPDDIAKINYRPCTHLILWPKEEVEDVLEAVARQNEDGIFTDAKTPPELEISFPWLVAQNTDIALGTHGNQDEALVDPIALRNLYRTLAQAHGANFIRAEVIDFNTVYHVELPEIDPISVTAVVARLPHTGELRNVGFASMLMSLGHNTPYLEARSDMESYMRDGLGDLHFIQPKLRVFFMFQSLNSPVINFPVITDTDGSMLIKEDYCGLFKYYLNIDESEDFFNSDPQLFMDLDQEESYPNLIHKSEMFKKYFDDVIKPRLAKRIPVMNDATFQWACSGFESHNTHDGSPVIGLHPFHDKLHLSGGYGSRLMNYALAAAIGINDIFWCGAEESFDLTSFYWTRVVKGRKIQEFKNLVR